MEDRQALLYEGPGAAAVNAFVEIVFDNSDNRFSLENADEVVFRRTVGVKKDEFFLQRKRATKNEVMSLLEGAGFSKSNPYFIVQQGKVNALCVMSDLERLNLLKEVAGTTVYDEKKKESLTKMEENQVHLAKTQESLEFMEQKLEELRGEKEELTKYQTLDRQRKAMAFTLYDKELKKARDTLKEIENARVEEIDSRRDMNVEMRNRAVEIANVEATQKAKTGSLRRNITNLTGLEHDKTKAFELRTRLDIQCKELEETIKNTESTLKANKREIERLEKDIRKAQSEQDAIEPKYEEAKEMVTLTTTERNETQKKMESLYAKQGRGNQFDSKEDRDTYLESQIEELKQAKVEKETFLTEQRSILANLRRTVTSTDREVDRQTAEISTKTSTLDTLDQAIQEHQKQRNEMAENRKNQWRALDEFSEGVTEARDTANTAFSTLRKVMPFATAMGLDALSRIVREERLRMGDQYFGSVMENFELVDPKFHTAVEVAAQNSLFHVIVDTDATAARLMKRLEDERLGRVTFLPLNQLRVENVSYPESSDVTPLLRQCLRYDQKVHKAMHQVFGKKLLARNTDVAMTWSTQSKMDAVTLEGDLCSRKGALTGGYVDVKKSRLRAHYELKSAEENLSKLQEKEREMKDKVEAINQQINSIGSKAQQLQAKKVNLDHVISRMDEDVSAKTVRLESAKKQVAKIESEVLPPIEVEIKSLDNQIDRLQAEIGTELTQTLTDEEKNLLQELKRSHKELGTNIESQAQQLEEVSVERQRIQSLLNDNLLKRKAELDNEGVDSQSTRRRTADGQESNSRLVQAKRMEDLKQLQQELDESIQVTDEIEEKTAEARKIDQNIRSELIIAKKKLEKLKSMDAKIRKTLEDAQKHSERLMNKRSLCISQRELQIGRIQDLGSLPPQAELTKYKSLSISNLMKELEKINKELKKYSHVNKKAYDQFLNFSEQRELLLKRKDEVDAGADKVKELVENLDRKKDEAINRTFRGVSAHFKDVFKELVPNGAGELIMRTALDDDESDDNEESSDEESGSSPKNKNDPSVSKYLGIGIKVRFSPVGENYLMSQLSGGQKTLVALALIFSIQRCDPAPFYLFDELDQALDKTYRSAVAALIQRQSSNAENPTQFICSTFRPEIVAVSNRCYGISHQNKISNVHLLTKKDALKFIADLMHEEEAVGEVTSLATSKVSRGSSRRKRKAITSGEEADEETTVTGEKTYQEEASSKASSKKRKDTTADNSSDSD